MCKVDCRNALFSLLIKIEFVRCIFFFFAAFAIFVFSKVSFIFLTAAAHFGTQEEEKKETNETKLIER